MLTLSLVNASADTSLELALTIRGGTPSEQLSMETLDAGEDLRLHNTFDAPDIVRPRAVQLGGVVTLPPASVSRLLIKILY
jgi:hypothetical protein